MMNLVDLQGKRILVTQADAFMGPVLCEVLTKCGAEVIADTGPLLTPDRIALLVQKAAQIDVLVANLAIPAPNTQAVEVTDEEWDTVFAHLVTPLPHLVRAVLPQMIARQAGKILLMGSASALRGMKRRSTYSAARGAQLAYIQALGVEMAPHKIQINAIAQNLVENPTYFPPEVQALPAFQERIKWEVPLGRLVSAEEDASFAAYLCSDAANCFVGQIFPVCGGWVPR
ncbi:short-chain dehydrogenase [Rugosibacter aromaticivorans]|uniref:Short-chain dehydrogenase n=1 Tax=Rugosibacter aromaticivorans TaxID=1565605 RepID=A0A0C5IZV1_9PROT|nr:SDR family oxidoreductase [Rugosibacter aromaticivorans]AJP48347.1 short-chain dehydrogenase [Rugosibacter aromaticivorans]TBR15906.1 MAG: SDR family oxidoreductase [Rugosibacter sp.]